MTRELEKKVEVLERSILRERKARKKAEELLELRSQEIYLSNQELEAQNIEAKLKQMQLSFLTGLSADIWSAESVNNVVQIFLRRAGEFLDKAYCVFFQIEQDANSDLSKKGLIFYNSPSTETTIQTQLTGIVDHFNLKQIVTIIEQGNSESQLIEMTELVDEESALNYCFLVPLFNINKSRGIACFIFHKEQEIDVYKLQTMESSRSMLTVAIQRKLAAISLQNRYKELKQTYEKLDDTQKQLVQSERMASIGQLAAGVAHEINNPIGFIVSNQETLDEYVETISQLLSLNLGMIQNPDDIKQHLIKLKQFWQDEDIDFIREDLSQLLNASQNGLKRVQEIVSGLKSFSHADTKAFEPINLNECLEDSIQLVWNELKYDCEIVKDFCPSPIVNGNSGQLQQVFVNMLVNAKQAMDKGGKIEICTKRKNDLIELSIADSGSGISKENVEKLFTPFFTTKAVGVGTGLGLSISYGILQDHDATIEVDSELDKGTTFVLKFKALIE